MRCEGSRCIEKNACGNKRDAYAAYSRLEQLRHASFLEPGIVRPAEIARAHLMDSWVYLKNG